MMRRLRTALGILLLVLCGRAYASTSAVLRVTGSEQQGDAGSLTISFNGHSETVAYGQYSSAASIASAFGGVFARDFGAAVCVHAVGQAIVVTLRGDRSFGAITVTGSTSSFQIDQSAWPAQGGQGNPLITIQCVPSTLTVGNPATCTASVSASATGTVTFSLDSGGPLANVPLSSGSVILSNILSDASVGSHLITAAYSGDSSHPASTAVASVLVSSAPPPLNTATVYSFSIKNPDGSSGYTANGNVQGYADSVNGTWSNLNYDGVNRLTGSTRAPVTGSQQYFCWSYDSFGNRTLQASSGAPFQSGSPTCQASASAPATTYGMSYDGNNRIIQTPYSSPSYDAAGNMTSDDTNQYLYDDEGRVCAVKGVPPIVGLSNNGMVQYIYDAEGRRVAKGTINVFSCDLSSNGFSMTSSYVQDLSGNQVTEMDGDGEWVHTNVYAAGQLLATYDDEGVHFHLSDWLGSRRVQTDYLGRIESTYQNLPFGEFLPNNNASQNLGATEHHFTGKERDTESGLDYFGARYYGSNMGRFMSPDFNSDSDEIEPVPYANLSNPQTLNLYSYARNNPLSLRDESGHVPCGGSASVTINVNANGTSSMSQSADDCPTLGFIDTMMFYRQRFINNVNANAAAHQPPPQPNNKGQALQDLNNIMMGAVLIGGPIAPKIKNTLDSIDKTGEAPPGQQGGRTFENDGRGGGQKLPSSDPNGNPINYKEWDVNAKQPGVNRGGERLVTGSDGSAYSTTDHYQTFTRVR